MVTPHYRLRIGGYIRDEAETWSVGLNFLSTAGTLDPANGGNQSHIEGWRDAIRALNGGNVVPTNMLAFIGNQAYISFIRTATINAQGKEAQVALTQLAAPIVGTGQSIHPNQVALTYSMVTGIPGASNRGRMYWPALAASLNTSGRVASGNLLAIANECAQWLTALGSAGGTSVFDAPLLPAVISSKGTTALIQRVRVGDRLDIQRRRADKQKETYGVSTVAN